eukprot:15526980-Heterocapsa_arctica.AAC.1
MANMLSAPFKRAVAAYMAYLEDKGLTNSRVVEACGASDSSAATYTVVEGDSGPASVRYRQKLEAERRIEEATTVNVRYSPPPARAIC